MLIKLKKENKMKHMIFKITGLCFLLFLNIIKVNAQEVQEAPPAPALPKQQSNPPNPPTSPCPEIIEWRIEKLDKKITESLKELDIKLKDLDFDKFDYKIVQLDAKLREKLKDLDFSKLDQPYPEGLQNIGTFDKVEKKKIISKSFAVKSDDKLVISNQYGDVTINTWAKNEIKVDVEIKATDRSEEAAQELLESVTITDTKQADLISFITTIKRNSNSWWSSTGGNGHGIRINYIIYMPSKNPLDIVNKYGSITIPDFSGPLNVVSSYGSFNGKNLTNAGNSVKVSYGSAVIEKLKAGKLEVSYGSVKLANAEKLNAYVRYSSGSVSKLSGDSHINLKYSGSFKINEIDQDVKNLNINSSYSTILLGFDPVSNFDFDITTSYANFVQNNKVVILKMTPEESNKNWSATKNYIGRYGKGSDSKVVIQSKYGSVKFLTP